MKGLLILYNGFEDCEALVTRAVLKKSNFEIITVTPNTSLEVFSSQNLCVKADLLMDQIILNKYDFLIIPGGPYVQKVLNQNDEELKQILKIIEYFVSKNKIIGAICAAPAFLGKLNLLKNHNFNCYPGYEKYIEGHFCPNLKAVTSGNFITSRSPDTVFDFASHLIDKLTTKIK
ncbi:DJ-1 family protein [Candidatus Phytoplasma phoenicium]|uniref:DJ-1 family protein n=1 Tax=Candidatus Phytoplasma phoenicium TaxID=198422 RepID=A0A2S8NV12_9MOLU|nr:DJ-1 family protein [Candidatus Phytoplasma phoenicium]